MSELATKAGLLRLIEQIRNRSDLVPKAAILLGTGLGGLANRLQAEATIPYGELKGMPLPTAATHAGEIILGHLAGVPVVAFSGRLHCYEGHSPTEVVVPVRLAKLLGADILLMGSAVGGLNPLYQGGDLVLIEDHINLMGVNPLVGGNDDALGGRWPDMIEPYDHQLQDLARACALEQGIGLQRGVYVSVLGPNLETRAEYRMLRTLGADVVGMSTVPETIAAVHCGLRTMAFAIVTDCCLPDALEPVNINKIIATANEAEPVLAELVHNVISKLP
jgi:purine-nucleoside phosphorylase